MIKNSQGKIFYGMHFYPGVAEYQEPEKEAYRVFLNEDTIRSMDPTFAGRPVFVEHVDEVTESLDELRKEADGWVIESFFNAADGKHWVKFIAVTERAERAIKNGFRLSNAYFPKSFGQGGLWNGVSYAKEIKAAEYEHLAIVRNPRYEESVIMNPEEFKKYNEEKQIELKRLSNSKDKKGESKMKFSFFKRTKVENGLDLEGVSIMLPKSKKEMTIEQLINEMDMKEEKKMDEMADLSHKVKMHDGSMMNVGELLEKHKMMSDELEDLKKKKEDEAVDEHDLIEEPAEVDVETSDMHNDEEDEKAKKKALELAEHEEKEIKEEKKKNELAEAAKKRALAKAKADKLRNANLAKDTEEAQVHIMQDQVAVGKQRYGSLK